MSNEELVAVIQGGAVERMGELWEHVSGLVKWKANQVMTALDGRCGVEFDDLYQSGYPALVAAVDSYNPESGAFSTWFMYHLKRAFAEATGYRTKSGKNEPLNNSVSLDTPLNDDSDSDTMMEVVEDPDGQKPTKDAEEAIFHHQLHEALDVALSELPEQSAEVLRMRHYQGMTLADIGEIRGTTAERIRHMENKAIMQLRKPSIACHLWPFYDFNFYCGTGWNVYKRSGMSIQERYLMVQEERRERAYQRFNDQVAKHQQEQLQRELDEITQVAQSAVASMTAEEKRALLEKSGYA